MKNLMLVGFVGFILNLVYVAYVWSQIMSAFKKVHQNEEVIEVLETELMETFIPILHERLELKADDYVCCVHEKRLGMKPVLNIGIRGVTYKLNFMFGGEHVAFTTSKQGIMADCFIRMNRISYAENFVDTLAHEMCHVKQIVDGRLDVNTLTGGIKLRKNSWFEKEAYPYGRSFAREHQDLIKEIASKYSL